MSSTFFNTNLDLRTFSGTWSWFPSNIPTKKTEPCILQQRWHNSIRPKTRQINPFNCQHVSSGPEITISFLYLGRMNKCRIQSNNKKEAIVSFQSRTIGKLIYAQEWSFSGPTCLKNRLSIVSPSKWRINNNTKTSVSGLLTKR